MAIYHKFKATPTIRDGRRFASKKEAKRYGELKHLQEAGEVLFFLSQVSLPLSDSGKVKYVCDFLIFWTNGSVTFEDVKGFRTPQYKMKKKLVEERYPIEIVET